MSVILTSSNILPLNGVKFKQLLEMLQQILNVLLKIPLVVIMQFLM